MFRTPFITPFSFQKILFSPSIPLTLNLIPRRVPDVRVRTPLCESRVVVLPNVCTGEVTHCVNGQFSGKEVISILGLNG